VEIRSTVRGVNWPLFGLFAVVIMVAAGATLIYSADADDGIRLLIGAGLLAAAGVLALAILIVRAGSSAQGGLPLTSGPAAPWSPILASGVTLIVLFFLKDPESATSRQVAVGIGFGVGILSWLVAIFSMTFRSRPENVNPRVYGDLLETHRAVLTRFTRMSAANPGSDAVEEAKGHLDWATRELSLTDKPTQAGVEWASGYAYINVWMALHRAEEALLRLATPHELAEVMLHDRLRISGSRLSNLRAKVRAVHGELADIIEPGPLTPAQKQELARKLTRTEIAAVRQSVNEFRDSRRDGLARARNRLNYTTLITAWTAYLVLVAAVGLRAPMTAIAAGGIFFLVGALIGLFAQLGTDAKAEEAVEDFGMAAARLRQTLIGSGLAAVGGVVVTAIVADATAVDRAAEMPNLATVFTVGANPAQLLVAAVFGLSPHLLIERLTATADRYRADLRQTATGDAGVPTGDLVADEEEP